ncbi:pseudouridine synthase [Peribacillus sp. SCS-155]|uniref:pseudouridine synthase n=1 Tax=Peribacillus sedimenti TaxID=3115297 RepID=UPI003906CCF3
MRIQKYIGGTGYCSRREMDRLIKEGRVTVNGTPSELDTIVKPGDVVLVDGKPLPEIQKPTYIALNKPVGITCTAAEHVSGNIIEFVEHPSRIFPVGRLDKASQGLILMTNDGEIVNKILRSEHGHEKEYVVTVNMPITDDFIRKMSEGVDIMGVTTKPCKVSRIAEFEFNIILTQGLNRQIRRMCKALGYEVTRLERIRIMNIALGRLETGKWRDLTDEELGGLLSQLT